MRSISKAMLCALLPTCTPAGHHSYTWDGGAGDAGACASTETVTQDLTLTDNDVLDAPSDCWTLNGKLTIQGPSVTSIAMLGQLTAVGDLEIANTMLAKIDTPRLIQVGGMLSIHDNAVLADISNLGVETDVLPALHVHYNDALVSLGTALRVVHEISGPAMVTNNGKLAQLDLHAIAQFDMGLEVGNNPALGTVDLSGMQLTTSLWIHDNAALTTLGNFGALEVLGPLNITNNAVLAALPMSTPMSEIAGAVQITNNAALTDLGQLSHTGRIDGALTITNNAQLDYCTAHEVNCCVPAGTATITGEKPDNNCHSYCATNGTCPY